MATRLRPFRVESSRIAQRRAQARCARLRVESGSATLARCPTRAGSTGSGHRALRAPATLLCLSGAGLNVFYPGRCNYVRQLTVVVPKAQRSLKPAKCSCFHSPSLRRRWRAPCAGILIGAVGAEKQCCSPISAAAMAQRDDGAGVPKGNSSWRALEERAARVRGVDGHGAEGPLTALGRIPRKAVNCRGVALEATSTPAPASQHLYRRMPPRSGQSAPIGDGQAAFSASMVARISCRATPILTRSEI